MADSQPSELELRQRFADPPAEYGPVDCWWWEAGELDRDRMRYSELHGSADPDVHNSSAQGLQGVSENFLVFPATGGSASDSASGSRDAVRYLCTNLHSARDQELTFNFGGRKPFPRAAWVTGDQVLAVDDDAATRPLREAPDAATLAGCDFTQRMIDLERPEACELEQEAAVRVTGRAGWNRVVLRLTQPRGRKLATYAVFHDPAHPPRVERYVPLLKWFRHPPGIRFDIFADGAPRVGWYRFEAPPGTRTVRLPLKARRAAVWVDGTEVPQTGDTATLPKPRAGVSQVALRVEHEPGYYAGAAFDNPVAFTCEEGVIALGAWRSAPDQVCFYATAPASAGRLALRVASRSFIHNIG